jgi:hypothetical protein
MKTVRLLASIATLSAVCLVHAADSKSTRVMSLLEVETKDPIAYAEAIKQQNEIAKSKFKVDNYIRVYQSYYDGEHTNRVRVSTGAPTVAELAKIQSAMDADPAVLKIRKNLDAFRTQVARVLYRAVRWEGMSAKGAHNYSALVIVSDEAAYLRAIDELRSIFDANGLKDAKVYVWRVIAGKADHTHRVVISTNGADRLAAMLDLAATQMDAWFAKSAPLRTLVANTTSREITR